MAGMVGILIWHCTAYVSVKVTNQCFFGSYERCPGLTHALPNVAKVNIQQNFQISFCKNAEKQIYLHHVKPRPKRCHLNGHTIGFSVQTQKLEPPQWQDSRVDSERKLQAVAQIFFIMYVFVNSEGKSSNFSLIFLFSFAQLLN